MEGFQIRVNPNEFTDAELVATQGQERFPAFAWAISSEPMAWPAELSDDQWLAQDWLNEEREARGLPLPVNEARHEAPREAAPAHGDAAAPGAGPLPSQPDFWQVNAPLLLQLATRMVSVRELEAAAFAQKVEKPTGLTFVTTQEEIAAILIGQATALEARAAELEKGTPSTPAEGPTLAPVAKARGKRAAAPTLAPSPDPLPASAAPVLSAADVDAQLRNWAADRAKLLRHAASARRFMAAHLPPGPITLDTHAVRHLFEDHASL